MSVCSSSLHLCHGLPCRGLPDVQRMLCRCFFGECLVAVAQTLALTLTDALPSFLWVASSGCFAAAVTMVI